MGKILLYLSIVISLVTAGLGFLNHGTLVATKEDLTAANSSLSQAKTGLAKTEGDLKKIQQDLAAANEGKVADSAQLAAANQKTTAAEAKVTDLTSQLSQKDTQIAQVEADSKAKDARIEELSKTGGTAADNSTQLADFQSQLAEKEALITTLQTNDAAAKAQLADFRTREENRQKEKMRNGLEGRVLAVNQAWNFVVLSLGDRNGVVNNAEMLVKRGTQLIGKVKITSVEPSSSIADIVSNNSGNLTIQPGDNVIYKSNE